MTATEAQYVRRQVESRWFAEALYFGLLQFTRTPSAELSLYIGLACCGAAGAIADVQRMLQGEPEAGITRRPMIGSATRLVHEGFFHLLEAYRGGTRLPTGLAGVGAEILADLEWYAKEDFKGYATSNRKYSHKAAACGAMVLLRRMLPDAPPPRDPVCATWGEEIIAEVLQQGTRDAAFYGALPQP